MSLCSVYRKFGGKMNAGSIFLSGDQLANNVLCCGTGYSSRAADTISLSSFCLFWIELRCCKTPDVEQALLSSLHWKSKNARLIGQSYFTLLHMHVCAVYLHSACCEQKWSIHFNNTFTLIVSAWISFYSNIYRENHAFYLKYEREHVRHLQAFTMTLKLVNARRSGLERGEATSVLVTNQGKCRTTDENKNQLRIGITAVDATMPSRVLSMNK